MDTTWKQKLVVAAIDFGTTNSGFAYSWQHEYRPEDPKIFTKDWKGGGTSKLKTPTCLLLTDDGKFHSFGYEAEMKYAALAEADTHHSWRFFRRFKMLLYRDKHSRGLTTSDTIKDTQGREFEAIAVFTHAIHYMRGQIIDHARDRVPDIREDDIYYVLTTPAIWSEQAKAFMRKAARNARIPDDHLRIALEPECAAIYLHKTEIPQLDKTSSSKLTMTPDSCHVILDLGGGTTDIGAHRVGENGTFEEIIPPCGKPCGSDNINRKFENFIVKLSGGQTLHDLIHDNMEDHLELQHAFEEKKCSFNDLNEVVTIRLPQSFRNLHQTYNKEDLSVSVRKMAIDATVKSDKLRISVDTFKEFYSETINEVITATQDAVEQIHDKIATLSCVGGFSDCPLLKQAIKETFPTMNVIIPPDAVSVVMKGAVMFGRDQSVVNKRMSRYTIGLDWKEEFDSDVHPKSKLEQTESECLCKDIFKVLIRKGDLIRYDEPITERAYSVYCRSIELPFYRSEVLTEPKYVTDVGCYLIGSMYINDSEYVDLKVYFGDTELKAEAIDEQGNKHEVTFNFAESQV